MFREIRGPGGGKDNQSTFRVDGLACYDDAVPRVFPCHCPNIRYGRFLIPGGYFFLLSSFPLRCLLPQYLSNVRMNSYEFDLNAYGTKPFRMEKIYLAGPGPARIHSIP